MTWNEKYWDIISNLYWSPKYLGLKSISREKWKIADGLVSIPATEIRNQNGPLYSRSLKLNELLDDLRNKEEILNHLFNITFAIAGDAIISRLFCQPLGIDDNGPFLSLGREIAERFGWGLNKNVTQQDGLFVTDRSAIGIELKLDTSSSPEQLVKYAALMMLEEKRLGKQIDLGLMFIIPEKSLSDHWGSVGLSGPKIDVDFVNQINKEKLNSTIREIFENKKEQLTGALERLKLAVMTWADFRDSIAEIQKELDCARPGDQTLHRLLSGFRTQVEAHKNTGIGPRSDRFTWTSGDVVIVKE